MPGPQPGGGRAARRTTATCPLRRYFNDSCSFLDFISFQHCLDKFVLVRLFPPIVLLEVLSSRPFMILQPSQNLAVKFAPFFLPLSELAHFNY